MKIRKRLDYFLAKIAGREADIGNVAPPVPTDATEELLSEIGDKMRNVPGGVKHEIVIKPEDWAVAPTGDDRNIYYVLPHRLELDESSISTVSFTFDKIPGLGDNVTLYPRRNDMGDTGWENTDGTSLLLDYDMDNAIQLAMINCIDIMDFFNDVRNEDGLLPAANKCSFSMFNFLDDVTYFGNVTVTYYTSANKLPAGMIGGGPVIAENGKLITVPMLPESVRMNESGLFDICNVAIDMSYGHGRLVSYNTIIPGALSDEQVRVTLPTNVSEHTENAMNLGYVYPQGIFLRLCDKASYSIEYVVPMNTGHCSYSFERKAYGMFNYQNRIYGVEINASARDIKANTDYTLTITRLL